MWHEEMAPALETMLGRLCSKVTCLSVSLGRGGLVVVNVDHRLAGLRGT